MKCKLLVSIAGLQIDVVFQLINGCCLHAAVERSGLPERAEYVMYLY